MSTRTKKKPPRPPFIIGDLMVNPGRSAAGELPVSRLVTGTQISLPLRIFHGKHPGAVMWISAAVHGDEIAGVEIIRRVASGLDPKSMSGTLITVPIVNVHGFLNGDRYLPDRRDLNRSFPGSPKGSLAARVADLFMREIVSRCDVGIDLHTGSDHRANLPQIRSDLDDPETRRLSEVFGASLMIHAKLRDGSLRQAATETGARVLLYEGGEAWRFDTNAINAGVLGIRRILSYLHITAEETVPSGLMPPESRSSTWIRARRSGIALLESDLGDMVNAGRQLGAVYDSVGRRLSRIVTPKSGLVIGLIKQPLVNQGDAIVHIAEVNSR
jgi:predicted deacylase